MKFFTSDSHFSYGEDKIITREFRPFSSLEEMNNEIISIWNKDAGCEDIIYHLGDFVNYNWQDLDYKRVFELVKNIRAKVVLILGNNEKRIMENDFNNDFEKFKSYLLSVGFYDVIENGTKIFIGGDEYYLTHKPNDCNKNSKFNLFGHVHKSVFVKKYGFNVGVDNHYFRLFSEADIIDLNDRRPLFDENVYD